MRPSVFSLLALLALALPAAAQNTVESIRREYAEVQEHIRRMMDPEVMEPREYYNLHVEQNLPATGPHDVNIYMYYTEKPGQAEDVIYPEHRLQFATKKYNYAARQYYEEFLFDDKGQPMFIYSRYISNDVAHLYELRLWLDGQRLLRVMVKEDTAASREQPTFRDVYTGTAIPEAFREKCDELKDGAASVLHLFDGMAANPF